MQEALAAGRKRIAEQGAGAGNLANAFEQMAADMMGTDEGPGQLLRGETQPAGPLGPTSQVDRTGTTDAFKALGSGLNAVNAEVAAVETLEQAVVAGKVKDFHEVATQIKRADLALSYAMEVRNRLIDAYRETMRMTV